MDIEQACRHLDRALRGYGLDPIPTSVTLLAADLMVSCDNGDVVDFNFAITQLVCRMAHEVSQGKLRLEAV